MAVDGICGRLRGKWEESREQAPESARVWRTSRLTRDGTAEPVPRGQILRRERGQGNVYFPCSADHEKDWQPYPVDPYSAICADHTYYYYYNCTSGGLGKRTSNGPTRSPEQASTLYSSYLECYWPCASRLSVVNGIDTQLRYLTRWCRWLLMG